MAAGEKFPPSYTARQLGNSLVFGGILPIDDVSGDLVPGGIEAQTRSVFETLVSLLSRHGLDTTDLVRLNTYYVGDVPEDEVTVYWERMTRVRLKYLGTPGPAAMATRVAGTGVDGALITLEGEAIGKGAVPRRQRIMPAGSWDWSMPVPFSQGWRVGERTWIGGQISADERGRVVFPGDMAAQTHKVMDFIVKVIEAAGGGVGDLCHLKICYRHDGDDAAAEEGLRVVMDAVRQNCPDVPPVSAYAANLLYGGLMVEIDGTAVLSKKKIGITPPEGRDLNWTNGAFALQRGTYVQFGGFSPASLADAGIFDQVRYATTNLVRALEGLGAGADAIARINVFHCCPVGSEAPTDTLAELQRGVKAVLDSPLPPVTLVRSAGLPGGARMQLDGYCIIPNGSSDS